MGKTMHYDMGIADVDDFIRGDILGEQISSTEINRFIDFDITHYDNRDKAEAFISKLALEDIFAVQRYMQNKLYSFSRNKAGRFSYNLFVYLVLTMPIVYMIASYPTNLFATIFAYLLISVILIRAFWEMDKEAKFIDQLIRKCAICQEVVAQKYFTGKWSCD